MSIELVLCLVGAVALVVLARRALLATAVLAGVLFALTLTGTLSVATSGTERIAAEAKAGAADAAREVERRTAPTGTP